MMGRIEFQYAKIGTLDQITYRPMVEVVLLASNGEAVQVAALADSGADFCLFPLRLAKLLKRDIESLPNAITTGVGSSANLTYFDTLTIDLGNGVIFQTRVGFTEGMDQAGFGLLGQQGFFENYDVKFRHRAKVFVVEPS